MAWAPHAIYGRPPSRSYTNVSVHSLSLYTKRLRRLSLHKSYIHHYTGIIHGTLVLVLRFHLECFLAISSAADASQVSPDGLLGLVLRRGDQLRQGLSEHLDLSVNHLTRSAPDGLSALYTRLKVEDSLNVVLKLIAELFIILDADIIQLTLARLSQGNSAPGDVMGFTEGNLNNR